MFITHRLTVQEVNNLLSESFVRIFGNIVEHCPAAAIGILKCRPFSDPESIIQAVNDLLDGLRSSEKEDILKRYPDVIEKLTLHNALHSPIKGANNYQLNIDDKLKLMELNNRYKEKFGFPFVVCPKDTDYRSIYSEMMTRLQNSQDTEVSVAMREVKKIVRLRIHELVE